MEKLKGKYEVILGFVTLVVSLSAFKEELAKVHLELGYTSISLADYFLWVVYGFSICLYLYIIEHIARDTRVGAWKLFDYIIQIAYFLFVFILLTPILLIINIIAHCIYSLNTQETEAKASTFFAYFAVALSIVSMVISIVFSTRFIKEKKRKLQEEISEQEIIELAHAAKLFRDEYYSHSVLEIYKVLETHLYKKLIELDIRVPRYNQKDLIRFALQQGIIKENDMPAINRIRDMRNIAAHSDTEHTKQQAEYALDFVKLLLLREEPSVS